MNREELIQVIDRVFELGGVITLADADIALAAPAGAQLPVELIRAVARNRAAIAETMGRTPGPRWSVGSHNNGGVMRPSARPADWDDAEVDRICRTVLTASLELTDDACAGIDAEITAACTRFDMGAMRAVGARFVSVLPPVEPAEPVEKAVPTPSPRSPVLAREAAAVEWPERPAWDDVEAGRLACNITAATIDLELDECVVACVAARVAGAIERRDLFELRCAAVDVSRIPQWIRTERAKGRERRSRRMEAAA